MNLPAHASAGTAPESPWQALARPRIFWLGTGGIFALAAVSTGGLDDLPGFFLIAFSALLPVFLWCRRAVHGIPIYPIFTVGTLWTFGFPLIAQQPQILQYNPDERLAAAATIAMTNLVGTGFWYLFSRRIAPPPASYLGFKLGSGDLLFFGALLADIAFNVLTSSVQLDLDPAIFSIIRAIIQALAALGIFVLGYRAGQYQLSPAGTQAYGITMVALILSTLPSVLMVNGLSSGALALMAFAFGRGRLPWLAFLLFLGSALFLQEGKAAIREKYWADARGAPISFSHFPEFMDDWIGFSWQHLLSDDGDAAAGSSADDPQSLTERASLLHLFLLIQAMSPAEAPYLRGETYAIIPRLLVPRLFNEEKARTHLGTYLLAIHYDLQRPEDTSVTTIGFGLINEAMANFGYPGCMGLGAVLGSFYGWAARWSSSHPLLSLRTLFAVLILTVAFENEFTAGVYVTVLFQGSCALLLLGLLTMGRVSRIAPARREVPAVHGAILIPG
jgi:hypothetical protein